MGSEMCIRDRPRRSQRCQYRPTATAQSLWELLSYDLRPLSATHRLHLPSWMPLATLLNRSSLIPSLVIHMPIGNDNSRLSRRATPQGVTSRLAGRRACQPTFVVLPFAQLTAFTAGCGLVRRGVSSPGTTRSVFWHRTTREPHARSGSAATATRCSPREPAFGTRATMACGGLKKSVRVRRRMGYPLPKVWTIRGRSSSLFSPGEVHNLDGGRTRFLVPAGSRS